MNILLLRSVIGHNPMVIMNEWHYIENGKVKWLHFFVGREFVNVIEYGKQ